MKLENYKKMVELQHSFNILAMGENYLDLNLNWNSAIIAESGEMLESLGYKWWKKQEIDLENAKVEAIDLLHFVISKWLQCFYNNSSDINNSKESVSMMFAENFEQYTLKITQIKIMNIFKLIDELCSTRINSFAVLDEVFKKLEMSNEYVYIAYIVKNCLNKFRQDNGYKEGTYQKIWVDKEDNVVAYELANEIGANENLFDLLYAELEDHYNSYMRR